MRLIAEWLANHQVEIGPASSTRTVNEILLAYLRHAQDYYRKHGKLTKQLARIQAALRPVRELYGTTPAAEFGPLTNASYLLVTATPYALYLQPEEIQIPANQQIFQPIRPAFTELVPVHAAYIGGEFYFEQSQIPGTVASFLHIEVDPPELGVLRTPNSPQLNFADILTSGAITSLRRSIITFIVGGTVRRWQQQQADQPPKRYSFIVHTETRNAAHTWQSNIVGALITRLR